MEIPPTLLLLLPLSVAAGVDLYLTLLAVGAAVLFDWGLPAEVAITPLLGVPILVGLAGLYVAETFVETRPSLALLWHNFQLLMRPLGAGLLGLFFLRGEPLAFMVLGAAMTSVVAAFSHVLAWGQGLILRIAPDQGLSPLAFNYSGDLAAIALLALTLLRPDLGVLLATLLLLLGLILGRSRHGAVRFGLTLLLDAVWDIVSPTGWHEAADLPPWILRDAGLGSLDALRGAHAATWGVVGPGRFKDGWILQKNQEILFAFRQGRVSRFIQMGGSEERVDSGPLCKTIRYRSPEGGSSALFLQKGLIGPESHK